MDILKKNYNIWTVVHVLSLHLTCPELESIKTIRAEVISYTVWPPAVTPCGGGMVPFSAGPTNS